MCRTGSWTDSRQRTFGGERSKLSPEKTQNVAPYDRGGVSTCFVSRGADVRELLVGDAIEVDADRVCVVRCESFDERFRRKRASSGRARLNPGCLVDLVAQRGDFGSSACCDVADIED